MSRKVNPETGIQETVRIKTHSPILGKRIHEPILTDEEQEAFLAERERRSGIGRGAQSTGRVYLLSGILRCARCGGPMYADKVTPLVQHRGQPYADRAYVCYNRRRYGACQWDPARVLVVEPIVEEWLEDWLSEREVFESAADEVLNGGARAELQDLEAALDALEETKRRWDEAYGSGVADINTYAKQMEQYDMSRRNLLQRRESLRRELRLDSGRQDLLGALRKGFDDNRLLEHLSRAEIKMLYRTIFEEILWKDGQVVSVKTRN